MPIEAIYPPAPGCLFFALLWNSRLVKLEDIKTRLIQQWGTLKDEFFPHEFSMTRYYQKEMGAYLKRCFFLIEGEFSRGSHIFIKKRAMELERQFAIKGYRTVNVDPGLICLEQLLLISTKPYSHRIYVGENLYVELCYQFSNGHYHILPWTYPDYSNKKVIEKFEEWRKHIPRH